MNTNTIKKKNRLKGKINLQILPKQLFFFEKNFTNIKQIGSLKMM